jgi:dihydroxyacid dehydratase/phosphogluconate dehydratase
MNKKKNHIRFAWIVLICFIAGQTMVYSHQHLSRLRSVVSHNVKVPQPVQTVTDTCSICDMMHHTHMAIFDAVVSSPIITICETVYTNQHDYKGIALILSAGRSPPRA